MVIGIPTFAKFIDIPPPIVPAPITPTFFISLMDSSFEMSGTLLACLSEKNAYLCAAD